jgi:hypothetical protein
MAEEIGSARIGFLRVNEVVWGRTPGRHWLGRNGGLRVSYSPAIGHMRNRAMVVWPVIGY